MVRTGMKYLFAGLLLSSLATSQAVAGTITQSFQMNWKADQAGDHGRKWQYQNYQLYDSSLGSLNKVVVTLDLKINGVHDGDSFAYRNSFFTGWASTFYQLYYSSTVGTRGESGIISNSWTFTSASDLDKWTNNIYGSNGNVYLESFEQSGSYEVTGVEQLIYDYLENGAVQVFEPPLLSATSLPPDEPSSPEGDPSSPEVLPRQAAGASPSPVPEPSTFILLAAGLLGIGWTCRRRDTLSRRN